MFRQFVVLICSAFVWRHRRKRCFYLFPSFLHPCFNQLFVVCCYRHRLSFVDDTYPRWSDFNRAPNTVGIRTNVENGINLKDHLSITKAENCLKLFIILNKSSLEYLFEQRPFSLAFCYLLGWFFVTDSTLLTVRAAEC